MKSMQEREKLDLCRHVVEALRAQSGVRAGDRLLVAVSGGADSVALLCLLHETAPQTGILLTAAHLEHGIRGEASQSDAAFVRALCEQLKVPLLLEAADVPALRPKGVGLEAAAREIRYAFLQRARQAAGARYIVTGHHREDQAETLLLHLVRGSGGAGLGGMRPVSGRVIRPLLEVPKERLLEYLRDRGQPWREDATNDDPAYARNAVRTLWMPALRDLNPRADEALCRAARALREDEDYLWEQLELLKLPAPFPMPYGGSLLRVGLADLPAAMLRRHLIRTLRILRFPSPSQEQLLALEALARKGAGAAPLAEDHFVHASAHYLHFYRPKGCMETTAQYSLPMRGERPLWLGLRMAARPALPGETGDGITTQVLRGDILLGAVIRSRRPGDLFSPLGQEGTKSLKETLIDRKIERPFRGFLPLVAQGSRVLWICGGLPAQQAVRGDPGEPGVLYTLQGPTPWKTGG